MTRIVQRRDRQLQVLLGKDNRREILDVVYPHTAIGQLQFEDVAAGEEFLCTATLFTERHILTCAHCIYDRKHDTFNQNFFFVPGLQGDAAPFGRVQYAALLQC